jgi:hypothetical protein
MHAITAGSPVAEPGRGTNNYSAMNYGSSPKDASLTIAPELALVLFSRLFDDDVLAAVRGRLTNLLGSRGLLVGLKCGLNAAAGV